MQDARRDASAGCWLCSPADRAQHVHLHEGCCPIALRCASQLRHTSQQCKTLFFKSSNSKFSAGKAHKAVQSCLETWTLVRSLQVASLSDDEDQGLLPCWDTRSSSSSSGAILAGVAFGGAVSDDEGGEGLIYADS